MKKLNLKKIKNLGRKKLVMVFVAIIIVLTGSYFVAANYGFFGGGTNAPSVPEDTMTRGLVGSWSFDEGSGQTAYDASENGNNGTLGASTATGSDDPKWGSGKNGGGMVFDGVDDYVDVGGPVITAIDNITISAYVKWNGTTGDSQHIITNGNTGSSGYALRIRGDNNDKISILSGGVAYANTDITFTAGQWQYVVIIRDSGVWKIYLDTILLSLSSNPTPIIPTTGTFIGSNQSFEKIFNGTIDDVRIYNRALSADEVRYHYNRGGPVGYWNFDEGSGTTAYDSTENNNDGTLKSSGLDFDGVNDYIQTTSDELKTSNNFTISAWFKADSTAYAKHLIWEGISTGNGFGSTPQDQPEMNLSFGNYSGGSSSDNLSFFLGDTDSSESGDVLQISISFTDTTNWNYVTVTVSNLDTSPSAELFLNGVSEGTDTGSVAKAIRTGWDTALRIGRSGTDDRYFNGFMDEVRVYNAVLSDAEIARQYNGDFSQDPTANLVLLQHFEEGMACDANDEAGCLTDDSSGGTNDGTLKSFDNLTTWDNGTDGWISEVKKESLRWTNGKYKTAGNFDGGGDNIYQAYNSDFDFGTGSFSISSWFKHNTIATTNDYLLSRYDADQGFKVWMNLSGDMCFGIDDDATWGPDDSACTSGVDYDDNTWHHFSAYKNGTTGIYLYINGNLVSSDETISATSTLTSNSAPLRIGSDASDPLNSWEGMIDNTIIYPYARSADEIRLDYNAGMATHLGPSGKTCAQDPASCMDYGLVGSWGMDEGAGTTAYDASDNGNDGILGNGTTAYRPQWTNETSPFQGGVGGGSSLKFDGVDDYVGAGSRDSIQEITVEAWFKTNSSGTIKSIISHGGSWSSTNIDWHLRIGETGTAQWYVYRYSAGTLIESTDTFNDGNWHHISGKIVGNSAELYVDGLLKDTSNVNGYVSGKTNVVQIGIRPGRDNYRFNGLIDSVRIYNRALSSEEIRYHYNKGGPVAHWSFDEGSGTTAFDSSINRNNGTLTGTSHLPTWTSGKFGSAIDFDNIDDYVSLGTQTIYNAETISFWLNSQGANTTNRIFDGNYVGIYSNNTAGGGSGDTLSAFVHDGIAFRIVEWAWSNITQDTWYYVTLTYNTDGNVKLYVDGNLKDTNANYDGTVGSTSQPHAIGAHRAGDEDWFDGLIDDVRIYDYARSADEIRLDYNAGMATHLGPSGKTCAQDPASCMDYGLVGSWGMDEGAGTTIYDASDNGNDGTLTNGPVWTNDSPSTGSGGQGGSLKFDGVNDYVDAGNDSSLDITNAITTEAWIKFDSLVASQWYSVVIRHDSANNSWNYYLAYKHPGSDAGLVFSLDGLSDSDMRYDISLSENTWYHFVATYNGSIKKIFLDGVKKLSEAATGNIVDTDKDLWISGNIPWGEYFNGSIDNVRIYNRALSTEEIRYHYNKGGPVAHWKFDEGEGTKAFDSSINRNSGTLTGASHLPTWTSGKFGSAIEFDGVDDYVNVGNDSGLNIANAITIEAWANSAIAGSAYSAAGHILTKKQTNEGTYSLNANASSNDFRFKILLDGSEGTARTIDSNDNILADVWYHIVGTYDGAIMKMYIDGVLQDDTLSIAGTIDVDNPGILTMGNRSDGANLFNGFIDDVRIYNYARSADEILLDYNNGVATHFK